MNLIDAIKDVTHRAHLRRPHWPAGQGIAVCNVTGYLFWVDHNKPFTMGAYANNSTQFKPKYEDIVATDWEMLTADTIFPVGLV